MHSDYHLRLWPLRACQSQTLYSYDTDRFTERDLSCRRYNRDYLLPSDIYCRSSTYQPLRNYVHSNRYSFRSYDYRPILPRPISPVELPRLNFDRYQPPAYCQNCHRYDFSKLNLYNREPSFFPLAQNYYNLQTDYEDFYAKKTVRSDYQRFSARQRWKIYGSIVIFYFLLKSNLKLAKQKRSYYQRDFHRIRFLELLTAVHRVYLEPTSSIYKSLSHVLNQQTKISNENKLFSCIQTIIDQLTSFLPKNGILGTQDDESVLIYLLNCSLDNYPTTYFWSIERHLLNISYTKMHEHRFQQLDHFTTKYLLIATFLFRCFNKTLLLKPVKYRLTRGQLTSIQWSNTRLISSLLLYVGRHAIIYKEEKTRLPMPFPFEMKNFLIEDQELRQICPNLDRLVEMTAPKISAWACEYAERLQRHIRFMKRDTNKS